MQLNYSKGTILCLHLLLVPQVKWSYIKNKIILLVSETWQTMLLSIGSAEKLSLHLETAQSCSPDRSEAVPSLLGAPLALCHRPAPHCPWSPPQRLKGKEKTKREQGE